MPRDTIAKFKALSSMWRAAARGLDLELRAEKRRTQRLEAENQALRAELEVLHAKWWESVDEDDEYIQGVVNDSSD